MAYMEDLTCGGCGGRASVRVRDRWNGGDQAFYCRSCAKAKLQHLFSVEHDSGIKHGDDCGTCRREARKAKAST